MTHQMKLWHGPFTAIQSGRKDVELRLHDEKRQRIQPGDIIEFTDSETKESLQAEVAAKHIFPDFAALYACYNKLRIGYNEEDAPDPKDMEAFYPAEEIAKYGVVAIELRVIRK